jgi:hypothetical protein
MKKFYLHVAYITTTEMGHVQWGEGDYGVESEHQPKVTLQLLAKVRETIKPKGGNIAILCWQWYDED